MKYPTLQQNFSVLKNASLVFCVSAVFAGHAMAASDPASPSGFEAELKAAVQALTSTPACDKASRQQEFVAAWLHQDPENSLQAAEKAQACENIADAAQRLNRLYQAAPQNVLLESYAGAANSKLAALKQSRQEQLTQLQQGVALLDDALEKSARQQSMHGRVPVALEVRFVAASTFLAIPEFMQRRPQGQQLLQGILNDPAFAGSAEEFKAKVWRRAGQCGSTPHGAC